MEGPVDAAQQRKLRGAWYTPPELVALVVDGVLDPDFVERRRRRGGAITVVDPACGDGRFLCRVAELLGPASEVRLVGVDVDVGAVEATRGALADLEADGVTVEVHLADALGVDWRALIAEPVDLVVGNPPFLSQMAVGTTRGGSSARGGGPYADAAVEFLALAAELVDADGGRVAFVLPQSLLSARDAGEVRASYDSRAELVWSWWTGERLFDAHVHTCALAFEFGRPSGVASGWGRVVTERSGVPDVGAWTQPGESGVLGDRARLNANFRDEYYGMVPAVGDHDAGPKLVTSGLVDPGLLLWGRRPIRFAKQRFERPRIDVSALDEKMQRWARDRLVPKVLVANQTRIIEAVADPTGDTLPGVPVIAVYPTVAENRRERTVWEIAAVLTSPVASAWAWHRAAGTGLSADAVRLGPVLLADLPWPSGSLDVAVVALASGDVRGCAAAVDAAYGVTGADAEPLLGWWGTALASIERRRPSLDGQGTATS